MRAFFLVSLAFGAALAVSAEEGARKLAFVSDLNLPNRRVATTDPVDREELLRRKASGEFGGISAVAYDESAGVLYALSDSSKPVFFRARLRVDRDRIELADQRATFLSDEDGQPVEPWTLDPEGLAISPQRTLYVASEGYPTRKPPVGPAVLEFDMTGRLVRSLPVPEHYQPTGIRGVRANNGFEGLSISPDGRRLFVATEGPLVQDGPVCSVRRACTARILEYELGSSGAEPVREFRYPLDALSAPSGMSGHNGVSEILALNGEELLVLERGFAVDASTGRGMNQIRIYHVAWQGDSTELKKRLVLDLAEVAGLFSPGFQSLDNFEGMCFGPRLPDGSQSVIVVSDDNYREQQRTSLLLFRLTQE